MITTRLCGGIGNQCFQFAAGAAQAKRFGTSLQLDISSFNGDAMRQYSLDLFAGVDEKTTTGTEVTIEEDGMPYNPEIVSLIKDGSCLRGYWQTEKYWNCLISPAELRRIFMPRAKLTLAGLMTLSKIKQAGDRSIFLTVRRTDYVGNSFHGEMTIEYYLKALKIIEDRVGKDLHVFVFSDDPKWCIDNFKIPYEMTVGGNFNRTTASYLGREDEELFLMSCCAHAVMANSSYSWWGAYLGETPGIFQGVVCGRFGRVVVAPNQWFGPASKENPIDIVPERWIKI